MLRAHVPRTLCVQHTDPDHGAIARAPFSVSHYPRAKRQAPAFFAPSLVSIQDEIAIVRMVLGGAVCGIPIILTARTNTTNRYDSPVGVAVSRS